MDFEVKDLIKNLDAICLNSLEAGSSLCVSRTNYEVSVNHVLLALLESVDGDIQKILHHYGVDITHFTKAVQHSLESMKTGNSGRPVFSPYLFEWLQDAWLLASLNYKLDKVRSGILFLSLIMNPYKYGPNDYVDLLRDISGDDLKASLLNIVGGDAAQPSGDTTAPTAAGSTAGGESALAKFTVNFTQKARDGEIDPVFCRDREIRQMIDILGRRRKNNPILVGEAGVGKTAVVEGMALSIVKDEVPQILQGVELYGLDMGLLQAGASVKGEFEKRLKAVISEIKSSPQNIILFIDEAHTLIGAGGSAGQNDAANLLKPALARGELKTIAATTWSEYKKYFEKDPALARRFQLIKIEEPSVDEAVIIMRGLREHYEDAHDIYIQDKAIEASADLSARYLSGRQLPDKSVDLLDTACARVKISLTSKPDAVSDRERRIQTLERELNAIQRDINAGVSEEQDRVNELKDIIASIESELVGLNQRWEAEKELVNKILELRSQLAEDASNSGALKEIQTLEAQLAEKQTDDPLVYYEVKPDTISRVISDWTGIPVGSMVKDEASVILNFKNDLSQRIKGQEHALEALDRGIKSAKAGLANPDSPIGVFLFVGPSGVGKTETAIGLADLLFGGERFLCSINMSEFQEKHTVSRLIGSPPGYVGYGEGGVLTEAVRQRPYSVVLLDEVEKADLEVMNLFYQVFDKGVLSDGEGREINFKNTAIILTSNLASDIIMQMCDDGDFPDIDDLNAAIRPILSNHFKPALLARMEIVPFYPISSDAMRDIVSLKMQRLADRLQSNQKMQLVYDDKVVDVITKKCTEAETGARNIDYIINRNMLPRMSNEILNTLGQQKQVNRLLVGIKDDDFHFQFD